MSCRNPLYLWTIIKALNIVVYYWAVILSIRLCKTFWWTNQSKRLLVIFCFGGCWCHSSVLHFLSYLNSLQSHQTGRSSPTLLDSVAWFPSWIIVLGCPGCLWPILFRLYGTHFLPQWPQSAVAVMLWHIFDCNFSFFFYISWIKCGKKCQ